jgi:hypothetical protein
MYFVRSAIIIYRFFYLIHYVFKKSPDVLLGTPGNFLASVERLHYSYIIAII